MGNKICLRCWRVNMWEWSRKCWDHKEVSTNRWDYISYYEWWELSLEDTSDIKMEIKLFANCWVDKLEWHIERFKIYKDTNLVWEFDHREYWDYNHVPKIEWRPINHTFSPVMISSMCFKGMSLYSEEIGINAHRYMIWDLKELRKRSNLILVD
jgi:hypothetical protein